MKNIRFILILTVFLVLAGFIGTAIRSYYLFLKEPVLPVVNCLPSNTAIIFKTSSVTDLLESIKNSSALNLFNKEKGTFQQLVAWNDSLVLKDKKISKLLDENEVVLALVPGNNNEPKLLMATSIGKSGVKSFHKHIKNTLGKFKCTVSSVDKVMRRIDYNDTHLWYFINQGLLVICNDEEVLKNSLEVITSQNTLETDPSFKKINSAGGKRVDAVMMINNKNLLNAIWPDKTESVLDKTPFAEWTTLDINIQKDKLLFGGFTFTGTSNLFEGQQPVDFDHLNYFPSNMAFSMSLSLSDQEKYISNFLKADTLHVTGYDASIKSTTTEVFRLSEHLKEWIGNSVSFILLNDFFKGYKNEKLVLVSHKNLELAKASLNPYIKPVEDSIGQMYYSNFTNMLWGPYFKLGSQVYVVVTKNNVVFSSSLSALKTYRSEYTDNKVIYKRQLAIAEHSSNTSNLFIYTNPKAISQWFLKGKHGKGNNDWIQPLLNNIELGLQFSASDNLQFTHSWLIPSGSHREYTQQIITEEKDTVTLNTPKEITKEGAPVKKDITAGIKAPQVVSAGNKSKKQIAIFTSGNKLNMHDHEGNLLWSFELKGEPASEVFELDYNKDGKIYYLVATSKYLHIINPEGKEVSKSPVKLPSTMKGGLAVFDYDKREDYRLLYIGKDNLIYNITIAGKELPDWQKPKVIGTGKIDFLRTNGKDYLLYSCKDEKLRIFDRKGKERIRIGNELMLSTNTKVFENKTNSKGIFLTVTSEGKLAYINDKGLISTSSFGNFGNNPWFDYIDFDTDGSMDFIFCGKDKLTVFSKMKDEIFNITTKGTFGTPFVYNSAQRDKWILVRNSKTGEVIIIHNKKKISNEKTLISDTDPVVLNPGGNLKSMIITSKKGKLIFTPLT